MFGCFLGGLLTLSLLDGLPVPPAYLLHCQTAASWLSHGHATCAGPGLLPPGQRSIPYPSYAPPIHASYAPPPVTCRISLHLLLFAQGFENAIKAGAREVAIFTAASEAFNRRNLNCSVDESLKKFEEVTEAAKAEGVPVRGYVSCVVGCPYQVSLHAGWHAVAS